MDIHIIGGTYREVCQWPPIDEFHGSGGRAAELICQLPQTGQVHLHTAQQNSLKDKILANIALSECVTKFTEVDKTPTFSYFHPLSTPQIYPTRSVLDQTQKPVINVNQENVLVFGMLEAELNVTAHRLVYDPQNPLDPKGVKESNLTAREVALVINLSEAKSLYKKHVGLNSELSPEEIAQQLMTSECLDVIVIKCGYKGAYVLDNSGLEGSWINAYETRTVFPIGSGDCFAAAFAYYWMTQSLAPIDAAKRASIVTAYYCENRTYPFESNVDQSLVEAKPLNISTKTEDKTVYLAGPFFNLREIWMINEARAALSSFGLNVFSPYHDVGVGSADEVVKKDIEAIEQSDIVYALFDGNDPGTLFEIGYAIKCNKSVVIFAENATTEELKMYEGMGCFIYSDFTTSIYQSCWKAYV